MFQMQKELIWEQKPLLIVQANCQTPQVQETLTWVRTIFQQKTPWEKKEVVFEPEEKRNIYSYQPQRSDFSESLDKPRQLNCYFSTWQMQSHKRFQNLFFWEFFKELCFEYLRYVEKSDYDLVYTHRFMPYAWEMGLSFETQASSDQLWELFQEFFHKTQKDFDLLQSQIYLQMTVLTDQPVRNYYYLMQEYFFSQRYRSIEETAIEILNISYEEFQVHYDFLLRQMSWEITEK